MKHVEALDSKRANLHVSKRGLKRQPQSRSDHSQDGEVLKY